MSLRENQKMTEQGTTGMDMSGTGNDNGVGIGNGLVELISPARSVNAENIIAANYQTVNQSIRIALNQRSLTHQTGTAAAGGRVTTLTPAELTISNTVRQGLTTDIHTATLDTLYKRYQTNLITGLTSEQVAKKHIEDGYNELTPPPQPSYIWLFLNQLIAGFNFILWIASVLFVLCWKPIGQLNGGKPDPTNAYVAIFLLLVILISAFFNTWQEIKSLIIVKSFSSMLPGYATVRRDGGIETQILARDLVLGDIVILKMGEKVPADIRIIGCEGLQVNNSSLTGESEPVHSTTRCTSANYMESLNLVFYSSLILQGSAIGVVVGIGDDTVLGQVSKLTQQGSGQVEDTSLHRQIRRFVWMITCIAITTGSVCLIAWGAWLYQDHLDYMPVGSIIINAVSLIVAYVPEGLPVCVTLTLTLIAKRMYAQHVLVRNLAIIETFNSVSFIASDKTGTLTQNEMTVTEMVTGPGIKVWNTPTKINVQDEGVIEQYRLMKHDPIINKMLLGGILCNAARLQLDDDPDAEGAGSQNATKKERIIGDAADTALYHLVTDHFALSATALRIANVQLASLPFNSKNKLMITANQSDGDETAANTCSIYMKGAPEYILQYCRSTIDKDGNIIPLDAHARTMIAQVQEQLGATGKRVIGLAVQTIPSGELRELADLEQNMNRPGDAMEDPGAAASSGGDIKHGGVRRTLEGFPADDYIFYGLFALMDPPRTEVPGAIIAAHEAGIRVAMVTGDHPSTAAAIAKQVGILPAEASESGIHTLSLGRDELNRMCVQISRHGQLVHTHVLGSKTALKENKTIIKGKNKDQEDQHIEGDIEMGIVPNRQAAKSHNRSSAGAMSHLFEDHTVTNQRTQSIRFHDIDEDVTSSVAQHSADEAGRLIGLVDGFNDEWLLTPQYNGARRVFLPYGVVVTGTDLNVFDDYMWAFVLSHQHIVFARTTPEQKLRIVQQAQARDEIVAVTGDGTNDAPALKASDLGVAMASGTEVAREAGDLMLLDNNFASIISAIETGRVVADNLKKVCLYLLPASTWSEMWPVMANVFLGMPLPLYTFQMILLSVITDVFDAMALVHEKPERAIMKRPPVIPAQNKLVDWKLLYHAYIELGMICSLCGFFNFFWYMGDQGCSSDKIFFAWANWGTDGWCGTGDMLGSDQLEMQYTGQSIFFVSLVICNWFNMFSTRTRYTSILDHNPLYGRGQNLWLFVALIGTILVAIFVTQVSWFNTTFYTRPVPIKYVMPAFGFGAFMLLLDEVRKWNWRHRPNSLWAKMAW